MQTFRAGTVVTHAYFTHIDVIPTVICSPPRPAPHCPVDVHLHLCLKLAFTVPPPLISRWLPGYLYVMHTLLQGPFRRLRINKQGVRRIPNTRILILPCILNMPCTKSGHKHHTHCPCSVSVFVARYSYYNEVKLHDASSLRVTALNKCHFWHCYQILGNDLLRMPSALVLQPSNPTCHCWRA